MNSPTELLGLFAVFILCIVLYPIIVISLLSKKSSIKRIAIRAAGLGLLIYAAVFTSVVVSQPTYVHLKNESNPYAKLKTPPVPNTKNTTREATHLYQLGPIYLTKGTSADKIPTQN